MPGLFRLGACEYDDMHIVALGYAEPIVTVGSGSVSLVSTYPQCRYQAMRVSRMLTTVILISRPPRSRTQASAAA